jgi:hypothetical protein
VHEHERIRQNVRELHHSECDCGTPNPAQARRLDRLGFLIHAVQNENQKDDSADGERLKSQYRAAKQYGEEAENLKKPDHAKSGASNGKGNLAASDVAVRSEHLPAQPVCSRQQPRSVRNERIRGALFADFQRLRETCGAHERQARTAGVNAHVESQFDRDIGASHAAFQGRSGFQEHGVCPCRRHDQRKRGGKKEKIQRISGAILHVLKFPGEAVCSDAQEFTLSKNQTG